MDKIYVVMITEAWYEGTYGDCKAIFNDREKAINYARKWANKVLDEDYDEDDEDSYRRHEMSRSREYDRPLNNGLVAEFQMNTGHYYDWDYENTSYYSVLVFEKEVGNYFVKNSGIEA